MFDVILLSFCLQMRLCSKEIEEMCLLFGLQVLQNQLLLLDAIAWLLAN